MTKNKHFGELNISDNEHTLATKTRSWFCQTHGKTSVVMTFRVPEKKNRSYCLECIIDRLGLPEVEKIND